MSGIMTFSSNDNPNDHRGSISFGTTTSANSFTVAGSTIEARREEARAKIAVMLIRAIVGLIAVAIVVGAILLYLLPSEKFVFRDMLNLILAIGSVFSGLLGAAITFYFSSKI